VTIYRVLVTGGRNYADGPRVHAELNRLYLEVACHWLWTTGPVDTLVVTHGAARGADSFADSWAADLESRNNEPDRPFAVQNDPCPADWSGPCQATCPPNHRRPAGHGGSYCPAAGVYRNAAMLDGPIGHLPNLCLAFPGGNGTADMVRRAARAGVPIRQVA
jgi:YspA, cpYpsA-related SLOG family